MLSFRVEAILDIFFLSFVHIRVAVGDPIIKRGKRVRVESTLVDPEVRYCNNQCAWPITFHFVTMRIWQQKS